MALLTKPQQKTASIAAFNVDDYFFRSMAQDLAALSSGIKPTNLRSSKAEIKPPSQQPAPSSVAQHGTTPELPSKNVITEPVVLPQTRPQAAPQTQTTPKDTSAILPPLTQIKPEIPQPIQPTLPPKPSVAPAVMPVPSITPIAPAVQDQKKLAQIQQAQTKKLQKIEADKQKQIRTNNEKQAKQLYKLAKQLYKKKNYQEAIINIQESLVLKPDLSKSKHFLDKTQKKLAATGGEQQTDATKAQQQAQEIALRQAEQNTKEQMAQEIERARLQAQQEVQQQAQELQQKITALKTERQILLGQQDTEQLKAEQAQQEKLKTETLAQTQKALRQQTSQQIDAVQQQVRQQASQQLDTLQQQLSQQEQALQRVQAQNARLEEQRLRQPQPQAPTIVQPPINRPMPAPIKQSPMPMPPMPTPPISTTPLAPLSATPSTKPLTAPLTPPSARPLQAPLRPQTSTVAKPQLVTAVKRIFPFKKLIIGIGAACLVLALAGIVYWRFALRPTPPQSAPATITLKNPNIIVKLMRPSQETAGWQKIVQLAVSSAIKLPLENYQIEPLKDINPWLGKELFYLNFDDTIDINQPSGAFVWTIDDKTNSQALFEKIKSRQRNQISLQNYRQFDIVNCQNQYWTFADIFNLHYLILGQNLSSIKSVLDNLSEKNLDFIEYAESQTSFWRNLPNTALYLWLDPANGQISLWQILRQLNLNVPVYVNQTLKNQAGIIFLDNFSPEIKDTRLAAIFGFADFDAANQAMTNWEKTLNHDVNFLFWNLKPTLPSTLNFQGNIYNNAVIRYLTMPDKNLGIYYGLTKEQLILTNSEDGVKMLIDNLQGI